MASSYELKRQRQKYYDLINDLNSAIGILDKVPEELEDADNYIRSSFLLDDERIDRNYIMVYSDRVESDISKMRGHISRIESIIDRLTREINEKEIEEELGGSSW